MKKTCKEKIIVFLKGFAMGSVDIIPGISGGTMALILGIYEKIISELKKINFKSVKSIFLKNKKLIIPEDDKINLAFLISLFLGIISAIISLAKIISYFLQNYPSHIYGLFFGLIVSSILLILPKKFYKNKNYLFLIPGFIIAWVISSSGTLNFSNSYINIFFSGVVAICAMILPGISGSFVLLILGKYEFMISALKNPLAENNLLYILIFGIGCVIGLLSFVRFLNFLLKRYREPSMAILIGFMAGALKKVWPFTQKTTEINKDFFVIILLIILGILIGNLLSKFGKIKNKE
ncbi:MAG TPA: DUF368 domain-containing protein [bacterium]|nr:DUF368 domain-containing protein [bacterium]HPV65589.1 DUF368 domain-containing protein [bacterium]